jgi:hypothetical protein
MSHLNVNKVANFNTITNADTIDTSNKSLFKIAGTAMLISVSLMLLDIMTTIISKETIQFGTFTATDWFTIYQNNWFAGLRNLGFLNILEMILAVPMFFAIYMVHKDVNKTYAAFAMLAAFIGMAIYISNNASVPMLVLSNKYAAASEGQRSLLAAAGEALLAKGEDFSPGAFLGFFLGEAANIAIAVIMLRGRIFGKVTSYIGIIGLSLLTVYTVWVTFIPVLQSTAMVIAMVGGPLSTIWSILIAHRLFQLGHN